MGDDVTSSDEVVAPPAPPAPSGLGADGEITSTAERGEKPVGRKLAGTWEQSIDDKFRFAVPADVRKFFGDDGAIARATPAGSVLLTPTRLHDERTARLEADIDLAVELSGLHDDEDVLIAQDLLRFHSDGVAQVAWDDTGRVSLRPDLRAHAGLVGSAKDDRRFVLVVGMGDRAEVWEPAAYAAYIAERKADIAARRRAARQ